MVVMMAACHPAAGGKPSVSPVPRAARGDQLVLRDDGDLAALAQAVNTSIRYWQGQPAGRQVQACGQSYSAGDFLATLEHFRTLLTTLAPGELPAAVGRAFTLCPEADGPLAEEILVTGYYQPRFKGRLVREAPFVYPVYRLPPDLIQAETYTAQGVTRQVGRLEGGRLVPYWTRAEIETKDLLQGNALCYLADPVEVFLLQVQGSGLVELADGTLRQLLFAGSNGRPYRSIGRLLADEGRLPLAEVDMPRIRRYLREHPADCQRILHYNERYIFFRICESTPGTGPVGSMGAVLTPGRSVALDQDLFSVGGLYFLQTERPVDTPGSPTQWQPMTRFVLHQDTGAAIKGVKRLDFFWGSGEYPERAAGLMKQSGRLYLLMRKKQLGS
jgi:membrane-bound lytic murein transglycosylase A